MERLNPRSMSQASFDIVARQYYVKSLYPNRIRLDDPETNSGYKALIYFKNPGVCGVWRDR